MDFNSDNPDSLLQPGILNGTAIGVDLNSFFAFSINDFDGRRIYRASTIARKDGNNSDGLRGGAKGFVAIKIVEDEFERRPRNLHREIQLLAGMNHPNILSLLNAYYVSTTSFVPTFQFQIFTPYYTLQLSTLLDSPKFLPTFPSFEFLCTTLTYQMLSAIDYLHTFSPPIAHRDISKGNFVIGEFGRIILIDFGIAMRLGDNDLREKDTEKGDRDGRKEGRREMETDIGTGSYRAPELLLGAQNYNPFALDLWCLGTVLAEFFTPLISILVSLDQESDYEDRQENRIALERQTLFDSSRSNIAQLCSIFSLLGTPTIYTWPESNQMRDFSRITFQDFPNLPFSSRLIHLYSNSVLNQVIEGLIRISASERISARVALDLFKDLDGTQIDWESGAGDIELRLDTILKELVD